LKPGLVILDIRMAGGIGIEGLEGIKMSMTRALIVAESLVARVLIRLHLQFKPNIRVVGDAHDILEGLARANYLKPDLILIDMRSLPLDALRGARFLKDLHTGVRVLIIGADDNAQTHLAFEASGADGFLLRSRLYRDLYAEIDRLFAVQTRQAVKPDE
jgi:two-component system, NarL family, response regulator DevR